MNAQGHVCAHERACARDCVCVCVCVRACVRVRGCVRIYTQRHAGGPTCSCSPSTLISQTHAAADAAAIAITTTRKRWHIASTYSVHRHERPACMRCHGHTHRSLDTSKEGLTAGGREGCECQGRKRDGRHWERAAPGRSRR